MIPGQTIEVDGKKWIVMRVDKAGARIERLELGEKPKPLPNRKARRKLWAEIRRKTRKAKVE